MTKHACFGLLAGLAALLLTGCATVQISGEGSRQEMVILGNVGITGEDHELTILPGSQVTKLSIIGEGIEVVVRPGATVDKIEIVGDDNEVTVPEDMPVEYSQIGDDNRLRYRP